MAWLEDERTAIVLKEEPEDSEAAESRVSGHKQEPGCNKPV